MRPVPIDDVIVGLIPGRRIVVGPPGNDLELAIPPVEAMLEVLPSGSTALSVRCILEGDDLEKLKLGQSVWITFLGHMVPFDVRVGP